jgi:hypothetical protein
MYRMLLAASIVFLATLPGYAVMIGNFPGLQELIDKSDAVVILRVDRHIDADRTLPNLLSTHDCFIYQALKGPIKPKERIQLRLMDTRTSFVTPFALSSTHLMFLTKKRTPDEPTDYRTIQYQGANIRLGHLRHEKMPEGESVADKVRSVIRRSIEASNDEHANEFAFYETMLGKVRPAATDEKKKANAADVPGETSSLTGRILYDGPPPEPRQLRIPLRVSYFRDGQQVKSDELPERRRIKDLGVPDESLIVGADGGIANVIIWVRSKNIPVPPPDAPKKAVTVRALNGRFKPHVLAYWKAVPLQWINDSDMGINFNWQGQGHNRAMAKGQTADIEVRKSATYPYPLTSNIQPWFKAYILPLEHPYFAVTDRAGWFEIKDLPPGTWDFAIWHERTGWLGTDKFPRGRFTLEIERGENSLGDLRVDPKTLAKPGENRADDGRAGGIVAADDVEFSPLHTAAIGGHSGQIRDLLDQGANVNIRESRFQGTPLHYASRKGHGETVQALIENRATVDVHDTRARTPLIWAAKGGHADVVRRLLDAGEDVNAQDSGGWTPFHFAIDRDHRELAQLLIDRGADPLVKNSQGQTPVDLNPDLDLKVPWRSLHARPASQ